MHRRKRKMTTGKSRVKHKPEIIIAPHAKKLRSKLLRRRRSQFYPVFATFLKSTDSRSQRSSSDFPSNAVNSSCFSQFRGEASCNSNEVSVLLDSRNAQSKGRQEIKKFDQMPTETELRRFGRSDWRHDASILTSVEVEASQSSCVESCALTGSSYTRRKTITKSSAQKQAGLPAKIEPGENAETNAASENSCMEHLYTKNESNFGEYSGRIIISTGKSFREEEKDAASIAAVVEKYQNTETVSSDSKRNEDAEASVSGFIFPETAPTYTADSEISGELMETHPGYSDLACSEQILDEDFVEFTSSTSTLFHETFEDSSDLNFSDYTPSMWLESGTEFSEQSPRDSSPSPTFSMLIQYRQEFSALRFPTADADKEYRDEFILQIFEAEEDEVSYQQFKNRERREAYFPNYAGHYCSTTECGNLVLEQRLMIVKWIVQFATKELQMETLFLGINLLDRFLSKGYFKSKKSLQIVGIACLMLATRIEENQPLSSIRQKIISIGSTIRTRYEVVAMEWLVQEVLEFRCFLPTIYNFLWFYLKAARAKEEVEKKAQYLAVLALHDHRHLNYWPSTVAAALIILASLSYNEDASCVRVMETHVRTKEDDLSECIKSLEWLVKQAG